MKGKVQMTTLQPTINPYPDVPVPAGEHEWIDDWQPDVDDGDYRAFMGSQRVVPAVPVATLPSHMHVPGSLKRPWSEDIVVQVNGMQRSDGRVEREIQVGPLHHDDPITLDQAIELRSALDYVIRAALTAQAEEAAR
jgi:hypothetical protein